MDALASYIYNVSIAFEILDYKVRASAGWIKTSGHLIWDLKIDFTRKARWVKDGHCISHPKGLNLMYFLLNNLKVTATVVCNAYLQAPSSRKYFIVCNDDFGIKNKGNGAII